VNLTAYEFGGATDWWQHVSLTPSVVRRAVPATGTARVSRRSRKTNGDGGRRSHVYRSGRGLSRTHVPVEFQRQSHRRCHERDVLDRELAQIVQCRILCRHRGRNSAGSVTSVASVLTVNPVVVSKRAGLYHATHRGGGS